MKRMLFSLIAAACMLAILLAGCAPAGEGGQSGGAGGGNTDNQTYYTVTFDSRGGSAVESQRVIAGNPLRRPETPELDRYFLNGWFQDEGASEDEWNFETDRVTSNLTLYAGWTEQGDMTPTASLVFERNERGDGYTVTDVGEETHIVIPAEYNGLPVTAIQGEYGTGAFARSAVTIAYLPDSIEVIGQNSFANCSSLTGVVLSASSRLSQIGNNAFSGCSSLESFYLPAGAVTLGNSVFNNCGSLQEFTVAEGNTAYRAENGHLIERATNTLLRGGHNGAVPESVTAIAQAAFRRTSGITRLYVPTNVKRIGNYFIADSSITTIAYQGTGSEWNAIEKSEDMWNYGNREVALQFSASSSAERGGILVAYFSNTGNTQGVAEVIAEQSGGTLWEIVPAVPYTAADLNYSNSSCRARQEYNDPACRPAIAGTVADMGEYDAVFVGYPIWWSSAPRIVQTFLEGYGFGETPVYIFSTSSSSGGSGAYGNLRSLYTGINFAGNLHFTSSQLSSAETRVADWLEQLGTN